MYLVKIIDFHSAQNYATFIKKRVGKEKCDEEKRGLRKMDEEERRLREI